MPVKNIFTKPLFDLDKRDVLLYRRKIYNYFNHLVYQAVIGKNTCNETLIPEPNWIEREKEWKIGTDCYKSFFLSTENKYNSKTILKLKYYRLADLIYSTYKTLSLLFESTTWNQIR